MCTTEQPYNINNAAFVCREVGIRVRGPHWGLSEDCMLHCLRKHVGLRMILATWSDNTAKHQRTHYQWRHRPSSVHSVSIGRGFQRREENDTMWTYDIISNNHYLLAKVNSPNQWRAPCWAILCNKVQLCNHSVS